MRFDCPKLSDDFIAEARKVAKLLDTPRAAHLLPECREIVQRWCAEDRQRFSSAMQAEKAHQGEVKRIKARLSRRLSVDERTPLWEGTLWRKAEKQWYDDALKTGVDLEEERIARTYIRLPEIPIPPGTVERGHDLLIASSLRDLLSTYEQSIGPRAIASRKPSIGHGAAGLMKWMRSDDYRYWLFIREAIPQLTISNLAELGCRIRKMIRTRRRTDVVVGQVTTTTRKLGPPCPKCGKKTKITTSGLLGSRYRRWKCKSCGETGKQARTVKASV